MSPGDPLVFLPGLGCDERLFAHQLAHLSDVAKPTVKNLPDATDVGAMAAGILADAPQRFSLAGLSMGGYVAFEIMRQAPARVIRLALLDTKADLDTPALRADRRAAVDAIRAGGFRAHVERRLPLLLGPLAFADEALQALTRSMASAIGADRYGRQLQAIIERPDSMAGLADLRCPTLVLCGRDDALTPLAKHEVMATAIAGARLCVVEEAGHLTPVEQPVAVTALLRDWLLHDR